MPPKAFMRAATMMLHYFLAARKVLASHRLFVPFPYLSSQTCHVLDSALHVSACKTSNHEAELVCN